jgi:hypothetical protein
VGRCNERVEAEHGRERWRPKPPQPQSCRRAALRVRARHAPAAPHLFLGWQPSDTYSSSEPPSSDTSALLIQVGASGIAHTTTSWDWGVPSTW